MSERDGQPGKMAVARPCGSWMAPKGLLKMILGCRSFVYFRRLAGLSGGSDSEKLLIVSACLGKRIRHSAYLSPCLLPPFVTSTHSHNKQAPFNQNFVNPSQLNITHSPCSYIISYLRNIQPCLSKIGRNTKSGRSIRR